MRIMSFTTKSVDIWFYMWYNAGVEKEECAMNTAYDASFLPLDNAVIDQTYFFEELIAWWIYTPYHFLKMS